MKIFLDTADTAEILKYYNPKLFDGITTNPTICAKVGETTKTIIPKIAELSDGVIFAQVTETNAENIINEAHKLSDLSCNRIIVKIPINFEGLKAIERLSEIGVKTAATACFSISQGVLAAKAGADYVIPYVSRMEKANLDFFTFLVELSTIFYENKFNSKILCASFKTRAHVEKTLAAGINEITITPDLIPIITEHELTSIAIENFLKDSKKQEI
ncbi:MAG: transaldolase family protein [Pseudomonadota bacterium]